MKRSAWAEADKVIDKPQRCRVKCSVLRRLWPITFTTYETVPFLVPMSVNGQLKVMLSENERLSRLYLVGYSALDLSQNVCYAVALTSDKREI